VTQPRQPVQDRRVQKTHQVLRDALNSLIREKSYHSIAVREILDRANVGRSTFYTHYRDKDELLLSGIHRMLSAARTTELPSSSAPHDRILGFSLPIFEHLRKVLAGIIAEDVRRNLQSHQRPPGKIPPDFLVQYLASTFILVLNWWVESGRLPPDEVNDLFRALVLPALAGASAHTAPASLSVKYTVPSRPTRRSLKRCEAPSSGEEIRRTGRPPGRSRAKTMLRAGA